MLFKYSSTLELYLKNTKVTCKLSPSQWLFPSTKRKNETCCNSYRIERYHRYKIFREFCQIIHFLGRKSEIAKNEWTKFHIFIHKDTLQHFWNDRLVKPRKSSNDHWNFTTVNFKRFNCVDKTIVEGNRYHVSIIMNSQKWSRALNFPLHHEKSS